ncbi:MAG TPA: hypothetical protein VME92_13270 [Acetobacteraceae bacterium]|nr:hypothetical protein [Acetobacteraceae bacterium]
MRKALLAGVALAGVAALLPTGASAQSAAATPPTSYPITARSDQLAGAAPGSVTVNLGGRIFSGVWFQSSTDDNFDGSKPATGVLMNYIRLYPSFDYASPYGVHYGLAAEIRANSSNLSEGHSAQTLFWHSAYGYVLSDKFGKFEFGTPNDAIDQLSVGGGDDFGTGGFYGEYGFKTVGPNYIMGDSYDGDNPKGKLAYVSPIFAGLNFAISYQPQSVGLNNTSVIPSSYNSDEVSICDGGSGTCGESKNRVEVAGQYSGTFGPLGVRASLGYAHAAWTPDTATLGPNGIGAVTYNPVDFWDAGAVLTYAGFELEGQVVKGNMSYANTDSGNPLGPAPDGAKQTTAFQIGLGYKIGALNVGVTWYHVNYDVRDTAPVALQGLPSTTARINGGTLGASYVVGPGVTLFLDVLYAQTHANDYDLVNNVGPTSSSYNPSNNQGIARGIGLGTYFQF